MHHSFAEISTEDLKRHAAEHAVREIRPGMVVGLGEGTTARLAVRRLAELLQRGEMYDIVAVASSRRLERWARALGISTTTLQEHPVVDLTIDGADEVSPALNLIKGRGGALLREKIVAQASRREVIIVDETKLSPALGTRCPVPVEILPFGWRSQAAYLESLGARINVRRNGRGDNRITDQGNMIIDCDFGVVDKPRTLASNLDARAGIVAHGLFIDFVSEIVVGTHDGLRILAVPQPPKASTQLNPNTSIKA
ncbi:MAG: ribose-5-phosphate isomerase RpiA [Chitinivibrionales bacterium]|nr:ribose-5-phosphate isomerase RpiA [Chitinivibrionales bacterium]MBD3356556.1 ribose-5-phosphate isomerase RpiA [Chitinivibrionales bacterium]